MRLRNADKEKIYISHIIGYKNNKAIYSNPMMVSAQVNEVSGNSLYEQFGFNNDYRLKVLLEYNDITKYVNEQTRFWIKTKPDGNNYNYVIARKGTWVNNIIQLFLKDSPQSWDIVYTYDSENGIYEIQCFYDEEKKVIKIPTDSYFNVSVNTKIWVERPNDENDTNGLLTLKDKKVEKDYTTYYFK